MQFQNTATKKFTNSTQHLQSVASPISNKLLCVRQTASTLVLALVLNTIVSGGRLTVTTLLVFWITIHISIVGKIHRIHLSFLLLNGLATIKNFTRTMGMGFRAIIFILKLNRNRQLGLMELCFISLLLKVIRIVIMQVRK